MRIRGLILTLIATVMGGGVVIGTLSIVMLTGLSRAERESGTASADFQRVEALVRNSQELLAMLDILTSESFGAFVMAERLSQRCREDIRYVGSSAMFEGTDYPDNLEILMDEALHAAAAVQTADDSDLALDRFDEIANLFLDDLEKLETQSEFIAERDALRVSSQRSRAQVTLTVAGLAYVAMVVLIARWMLVRLVDPVQRLADAAKQSMRLDEPFQLKPNGPHEVRALTKIIGEFVATLESKVTARTSELERVNTELEQIASTDKLTGLPNRTVFSDRLKQVFMHSRRHGGRFAVLFFDFDRFKLVNDSLGHDVGDALLCDIARIFRSELRESDTVARFGGDEFVVLLTNLTSWSDAYVKAERLLNAFAIPHQLSDHLVVSNASIGLVTNERDYEQPGEMIRDADAAMYQAKENGRAQVVVFDQAMHANAMDRLLIEADLHVAVANDQLRLLFQPIVELETGYVTGFEALIRWEHPKRGTISPVDFITIAEDTGLIVPIGKWVLRTAAAQLADWNQTLGRDRRLKVNVNVSKRQLLDPSFLADAIKCRRDYDLHAGQLQLEITESTIADDRSDVASLLRQLREHGFPIAMDDFGTGVSSLGTLHEFPIDVLKIDQTFIRVLDSDRSLLAVVASITNLAENLGIQTVAEGIETADIVGALQSIGCTWGQGYYFAKPMPPSEVNAYLLGRRSQQNPRAA